MEEVIFPSSTVNQNIIEEDDDIFAQIWPEQLIHSFLEG